MISLNWIAKHGLKVIEKQDIETPMLIVPPDVYEELKEAHEKELKKSRDYL